MSNQQELRLPQAIGERLLQVPDYQRPYTWERKQLGELWEDLDLMGPLGIHYAGTLVLRPEEDKPAATDSAGRTLHYYEVVDGQQRLTTILILLDQARRALDRLGDQGGVPDSLEFSTRLRTSYTVLRMADHAEVPKLRLGEDLNDFWVDSVLGDHPHTGEVLPGQRRLASARDFYEDKVRQLASGAPPEEARHRLQDLVGRVENGLRFLVYEVRSVVEVGVIFETLNDRGRPLTDLEKTKNYLLYLARLIPTEQASRQLADFINRAWSEIFKNLSGEGVGREDQLLQAHWIATENPSLRDWQRVVTIKRRFERSQYIPGAVRLIGEAPPSAEKPLSGDEQDPWEGLKADVENYVRTLRDASAYLAESLQEKPSMTPFQTGRDEARRAGNALRRSGVMAVFRPLMLACRLKYPNDGLLYAQLTDLCERYSARVFVIAQRRADAGRSALFGLANDLYRGTAPEKVLDSIRAIIWEYAPDTRLQTVFGDLTANWYGRRGHKYFLYEYEMSLVRPGEALLPLEHFTDSGGPQRTTEHILPQTPDPADECWSSTFTPEEKQALKHSLGNLVLTLDNSSYYNHCFSVKRGKALAQSEQPTICYAQGNLHQERELATVEIWNPEAIAKRQAHLGQWAIRRWRVEPPLVAALVTEVVDAEFEGSDEDEADLAPPPDSERE